MLAVDGAFDSPTEAVYGLIPVPEIHALDNGDHVVRVRGRDAAGNWGDLFTAPLTVDKTPPVLGTVTASPNPTAGASTVQLTGTVNETGFGGAEVFLGPATPAPATRRRSCRWRVGTPPCPSVGRSRPHRDRNRGAGPRGRGRHDAARRDRRARPGRHDLGRRRARPADAGARGGRLGAGPTCGAARLRPSGDGLRVRRGRHRRLPVLVSRGLRGRAHRDDVRPDPGRQGGRGRADGRGGAGQPPPPARPTRPRRTPSLPRGRGAPRGAGAGCERGAGQRPAGHRARVPSGTLGDPGPPGRSGPGPPGGGEHPAQRARSQRRIGRRLRHQTPLPRPRHRGRRDPGWHHSTRGLPRRRALERDTRRRLGRTGAAGRHRPPRRLAGHDLAAALGGRDSRPHPGDRRLDGARLRAAPGPRHRAGRAGDRWLGLVGPAPTASVRRAPPGGDPRGGRSGRAGDGCRRDAGLRPGPAPDPRRRERCGRAGPRSAPRTAPSPRRRTRRGR